MPGKWEAEDQVLEPIMSLEDLLDSCKEALPTPRVLVHSRAQTDFFTFETAHLGSSGQVVDACMSHQAREATVNI